MSRPSASTEESVATDRRNRRNNAESRITLALFGRNTFWLLLDRCALRIATMVAGLILVRYLGPSNYGLYVISLSIGTLVNAFLDLGLTRYAAREVATCPRQAHSILAISILTTVGSLALEILGLVIAVSRGNWYLACVFAGLTVTNLEATSGLCAAILNAGLRSQAILPGSLLSMGGVILAIGLVIWLHLSVLGLLIGISVKSFLVVSLRLYQLRKHWPVQEEWGTKALRECLSSAWPFLTYSLAQITYERTPILCFGLVATKEEVGWLAAALLIAGIFPQWTYASNDALLPLLSRMYVDNRKEELLHLRERLVEVLLYLSFPVMVLLATFAPDICNVLGPRFASASHVLRIVSYRSLLSVFDGLLGGAFLIAMNRVTQRTNAQAKVLPMLAILTLVFGHLWGATGCALALLIADVSILFQYRHIFLSAGFPIQLRAIWSAAAAGVAMAIVGVELPHTINWIYRVPPALVSYFTVLVVLARARLFSAGRTLIDCFTGG